jgi:hypothetical protein
MHQPPLDGNAIAALPQELFAVEITSAIATCGRCGAAGPGGAVHVRIDQQGMQTPEVAL